MQEKLCVNNEKSTTFKSCLSIALTVVLAIFSAVLVLLSGLVCYAAFNSEAENTTQIFGYKLFYCENDIEGTDIKAGSLVIVKNTDSDEFYKADFLSENAVLVVKNLGFYIKQSGFYMALCMVVPFAFIFVIVLITEIRKIHARNALEPYEELSFRKIPEEEFILDD